MRCSVNFGPPIDAPSIQRLGGDLVHPPARPPRLRHKATEDPLRALIAQAMGDYEVDGDALFSDDDQISPVEPASAPAAPTAPAVKRPRPSGSALGDLDISSLSKYTPNSSAGRGGPVQPHVRNVGRGGGSRSHYGPGGFAGGGFRQGKYGGGPGRGHAGLYGREYDGPGSYNNWGGFGRGGPSGGWGSGDHGGSQGGGYGGSYGYGGGRSYGGSNGGGFAPRAPDETPVGAHMRSGASSKGSGFIHPSRIAAHGNAPPAPRPVPVEEPKAVTKESRRKAIASILPEDDVDRVLERMDKGSEAASKRKRPGRRAPRRMSDAERAQQAAELAEKRRKEALAESRAKERELGFKKSNVNFKSALASLLNAAPSGASSRANGSAKPKAREGTQMQQTPNLGEEDYGGGIKREKRLGGRDLTDIYRVVAMTPEAIERERRQAAEEREIMTRYYSDLRQREREEREHMARAMENVPTVARTMRTAGDLARVERSLFWKPEDRHKYHSLTFIGLSLKEPEEGNAIDEEVDKLMHVEIDVI